MDTLLQTELLASLIDDESTDNKSVDYPAAYKNFASRLYRLCTTSTDLPHLYFMLNYTKLELLSAGRHQEKK